MPAQQFFLELENSDGEWRSIIDRLFENTFTTDIGDRSACIDAFNRHNDRVRNANLGQRLLVWQPSDGGEPLCRTLDLDIPDEIFPHVNSTDTYIQDYL